MEELRPVPEDHRLSVHLLELESLGYTIIPEAIPQPLLARVQDAHRRAVAAVKAKKPEAEWSWESSNAGVVDYFRAYELDPAFEELMDNPRVLPLLKAAMADGRGRPASEGGPRLLSGPVTQHLPGGTPGGQMWHRDGDYLRCTYVLSDVGPDGGGVSSTACPPPPCRYGVPDLAPGTRR